MIFLGPGFFLETRFSHCCSILAAWASKEQPEGRNMEYLASKTNIQQDGFEICAVPSGPHFVNQDPGWGPKGQPKGHKVKCQTCTKNIGEFLLDFMRSYQDLTFSTRIQDGSPRDNQRDQKRKCLAGRKLLATIY